MDKLILDIIGGRQISKEESLLLLDLDIEDLFYAAAKIRKKYKGNKINICSVISAKSGQCPEDCKFCAQSIHNETETSVYPLISNEKIDKISNQVLESANCFGIVSSGNFLTDEEIEQLCGLLKKHEKADHLSLSIGGISDDGLKKLKEAGLKKIHHNLETSEKFFPHICSTHSYSERVDNIKRAKNIGYKICSGVLFGMGETRSDRIDIAFALKALNIDSVPMNFLIPIKGTDFENAEPMHPIEILKTIALFRIILQTPDIVVCGGREVNLRDMQPMIFLAGANGIMSGGYLTINGRDAGTDIKMIQDSGLEIK